MGVRRPDADTQEESVLMRWRRATTIGLTAFALLALAQPASAVTYVGLDDLT